MSRYTVLKGIKIALMVVVATVVFGFIVEGLWNALVPPIIGWHAITFWQALGLLVLSKILFGGFHRHSSRDRARWKERMLQRWAKMTPEERERFREGMRCGRAPFGSTVERQI